jgi:hypothetical protein
MGLPDFSFMCLSCRPGRNLRDCGLLLLILLQPAEEAGGGGGVRLHRRRDSSRTTPCGTLGLQHFQDLFQYLYHVLTVNVFIGGCYSKRNTPPSAFFAHANGAAEDFEKVLGNNIPGLTGLWH